MKKQTKAILAGLFFIIQVICGCSSVTAPEPVQGPVIQKGEWVKVNYTCGSRHYGLFTTTDPLVINDPDVKKARIFFTRSKPEPAKILAGQDQPGQPPWDLKDMIPEIRNKIAAALVGQSYGSTFDTTIESSVPQGMQYSNRYRNLPREKQIPRFQKMSKKDFIAKRKFTPKVGDVLLRKKEGCPHARVIAVTDKNVTVELITGNGCTSQLPWGTLTLTDKGEKDKVTARLDSEVGLLVKTGPVIGKVAQVNDKVVKVDYGHPFAGEALECRVEIMEKEQDK